MFIKMQQIEHGFSLLELLIVVSILGIVASVAVPDISTTNISRLELAAEEFAEAMRYARSEAIRSGQFRGVRMQSGTGRVRVFRADTGTSPWTPVFDIYHPVSKKLYDIELNSHAFAAADSVTQAATFRASCTGPGDIYFDSNGTAFCLNPQSVLLEKLALTLTSGKHTRVVTLNGITGRVVVQ